MAKYEEKAYQERKIAQHNELMAGLEYVEEYEVVKPKVVTESMIRDCSSIDRRVTWGAKKEKVELKVPYTYVGPSIETECGESESKQFSKKDTTMMGRQKPTKQLQLDDKSFFGSTMKVEPIIEDSKDIEMSYSPETMSNEGGNINDCEEIKNHNCEKLKFPVNGSESWPLEIPSVPCRFIRSPETCVTINFPPVRSSSIRKRTIKSNNFSLLELPL